jgi:hypothetical protein
MIFHLFVVNGVIAADLFIITYKQWVKNSKLRFDLCTNCCKTLVDALIPVKKSVERLMIIYHIVNTLMFYFQAVLMIAVSTTPVDYSWI